MSSELRPGYKQTEVGVIPVDWELLKLSDIASVASGGTPSRKISEYWNGNIPWVTTSQIDFSTINNAEQHITEAGLQNSAAKLLIPKTLLLALYGQGKTRGKVGILGMSATTNQACASIVILSSFSHLFIFYFLASQYEIIRGLSNSGSQDNLNSEIVKSLLIAIPPTLAEQQAIAEALSDADGLIEALEQLIAKKRLIKQGAMQELLTGKRRLPGFGRHSSKYNQYGSFMIPDDWVMTSLSQIVRRFVNGGTPSTLNEMYWQGNIPWITGADILDQKISKIRRFITKEAVRNSSTNIISQGDLLVVTRTGVGKLALAPCDIAISQDFTGISTDSNLVDPNYMFKFFELNQSILTDQNQGTSILGITRETLSKLSVYFPPTLAEQTAIATILSDMGAEIGALEGKLVKARQIKRGAMQELLTGRIRLV